MKQGSLFKNCFVKACEAGQVAQCEKCLPCKQEDLSSETQCTHKQGMLVCLCNPSTGRVETGEFQDITGCQPRQSVSARFTEKDFFLSQMIV